MSQSTTRRSGMRRLAAVAVAAASVLGVGGLASSALFTANSTVGSNDFAFGTVNLTTGVTPSAFTATAMAPGDSIVRQVQVNNTGSLDLRYALVSTSTENVNAPQFNLEVKSGVTNCTAAGFTADGTSLYGPAALGSTAGTKVFGDSAAGAQAGDRVLTAGASENLCVRVSVPTSAGNGLQGVSASTTFYFNAEQTKNNP